eukprot:TRINITY_DN55134_c0_g1_i1.p1 TRINITY_DN55134_c0_g1~~TRINITY_DN55134_c0_g1_i1.p1  ORF type:complete len:361 (+),score=47.83 TRINITY_DN55134_c0_g1_i1:169-1251(+)
MSTRSLVRFGWWRPMFEKLSAPMLVTVAQTRSMSGSNPALSLLWHRPHRITFTSCRHAADFSTHALYLEENMTLDRIGALEFYQLLRGNRITGDDVLCAWVATRAATVVIAGTRAVSGGAVNVDGGVSTVPTLLELGSGIGSVGLLTLSRLGPNAQATLVERQDVSVRLLRRNVVHNGFAGRVNVVHADLRRVFLRNDGAAVRRAFDLVVSNPPYMPERAGALPAHPQKACARFECHGGVEDFAEAAGRVLFDGGQAVFVHSDGSRTQAALEAAGLCVEHRLDVALHEGRSPRRCVVIAARPRVEVQGSYRQPRHAEGRQKMMGLLSELPRFIAMHDAANRPTDTWRRICAEMKFGTRGD